MVINIYKKPNYTKMKSDILDDLICDIDSLLEYIYDDPGNSMVDCWKRKVEFKQKIAENLSINK